MQLQSGGVGQEDDEDEKYLDKLVGQNVAFYECSRDFPDWGVTCNTTDKGQNTDEEENEKCINGLVKC